MAGLCAKKIIFTACHSRKLKLAFTGPDIISTSPKNVLTSGIDFTVLLLLEFLTKNITYPLGKLKTEFISPIAKSTSYGLSDTTFFAHWGLNQIQVEIFSTVTIKRSTSGNYSHMHVEGPWLQIIQTSQVFVFKPCQIGVVTHLSLNKILFN